MNCKICNSRTNEVWYKNSYIISRCSNCKFEFISNPPSREDLNKLYKRQKISKWSKLTLIDVYNDFLNSNNNPKKDFFIDIINRIQKKTNKKSLKILEIGSGRSDLIYLANYLGHNCIGIEASEEVVNLLNNVHNGSIQYIEKDDYSKFYGENFDLIYIEHALEHFLDINNLLKDIDHILSPTGFLAVLVPNHNSTIASKKAYNWSEVCPPYHLSFFKPESISKLFRIYNYEIILLEESSYFFRSVWQNYSIDKYINFFIGVINKVFRSNLNYLRYPYKYPTNLKLKIRLLPWFISKTIGEELFILGQKRKL